MTKNIFKRGFTLIELLVVIAIIGILASVVLASLNTARDKGADAAIKSTINNVRAEAAIFYDDAPSTYTGLCASLTTAAASVNSTGGASSWTCSDDSTAGGITAGDAYVITGELSDGGFYCIDSSGNSASTSAAVATEASCSTI